MVGLWKVQPAFGGSIGQPGGKDPDAASSTPLQQIAKKRTFPPLCLRRLFLNRNLFEIFFVFFNLAN